MSERQAGTYARKTGTPAHNRAMAILNSLKVPYTDEGFFSRPGERNAKGQELHYVVDILCYQLESWKFAVEVEGRGSKSRDNSKRDEFFERAGIPVIHVDNQTVLKTPLKFMARFAVFVSLLDEREGSRVALKVCEHLANDR